MKIEIDLSLWRYLFMKIFSKKKQTCTFCPFDGLPQYGTRCENCDENDDD